MLNDNDIHNFDREILGKIADVTPATYKYLRKRKGRQLRSILNKCGEASYIEIEDDDPLIEIAEKEKYSDEIEKDNIAKYCDYVISKTKVGDTS